MNDDIAYQNLDKMCFVCLKEFDENLENYYDLKRCEECRKQYSRDYSKETANRVFFLSKKLLNSITHERKGMNFLYKGDDLYNAVIDKYGSAENMLKKKMRMRGEK